MEKIIINNQIEIPYTDYDCSNILTYMVSPERGPDFTLNADEIVYKYIPKLIVKINYLSATQYISLIQNINTPHFKVKYYDYELMKVVERDMYCSDNSLSDVNAYSSDFKGAVSVTLTFASLVAYKDYNELINSTKTFNVGLPTKIAARFYFSNNNSKIEEIPIINNFFSPDGTWDGTKTIYNKSLIGTITGGQNVLVVGSALDENSKNTLGNKYQGMIIKKALSSSTATNGVYKMTADTSFTIKCTVVDETKDNDLYIEFDRASRLYATEILLNDKIYKNSNYMATMPLKNGLNTIKIISLNKPNQYCKINALFTSLAIDFISGDNLIDFKKGTKASDENGKGYYSLNSSYASLNIYDRLGVISSLANEKRLTNDTYVEIYLSKGDVKFEQTNLIGRYYTSEFKYSGTNYDKRIDVELKDEIEFLNNSYLNASEKNSLDNTLYDGRTLLSYITSKCYENDITLELSNSIKDTILSIGHCQLNKLGASFFEQLNSLCSMLNVYMWSDGTGKIKLVEGQ